MSDAKLCAILYARISVERAGMCAEKTFSPNYQTASLMNKYTVALTKYIGLNPSIILLLVLMEYSVNSIKFVCI